MELCLVFVHVQCLLQIIAFARANTTVAYLNAEIIYGCARPLEKRDNKELATKVLLLGYFTVAKSDELEV